MIASVTPKIVTNSEFTKYLENGTPDALTIRDNSAKLSNVGLLTKNFGGYMKSSLCGLKAWLMIKIMGNNIKSEKGIRKAKKGIWLLWKLVGLIFVP